MAYLGGSPISIPSSLLDPSTLGKKPKKKKTGEEIYLEIVSELMENLPEIMNGHDYAIVGSFATFALSDGLEGKFDEDSDIDIAVHRDCIHLVEAEMNNKWAVSTEEVTEESLVKQGLDPSTIEEYPEYFIHVTDLPPIHLISTLEKYHIPHIVEKDGLNYIFSDPDENANPWEDGETPDTAYYDVINPWDSSVHAG